MGGYADEWGGSPHRERKSLSIMESFLCGVSHKQLLQDPDFRF